MAIAFSWSAVHDMGGAGTGDKTFTHTFSGQGAAVLLATRMGHSPPSAVKVGAVPLTQVPSVAWEVTPPRYASIWAAASGIPAGLQTVTVTMANGDTCQWAMAVDVSNAGRLLGIGDHDRSEAAAGAASLSLASPTNPARGIGCMAFTVGASTSAVAGCTLTGVGHGGFAEADGHFCEEDAESVGTRSVGFGGNSNHAGVAVLFEDVGPQPSMVTGTAATGEGRAMPGDVTVPADVMIVARTATGEGRAMPGDVESALHRYVPLVGGGVEQPDFLTGAEGTVLTFHGAGAKPTAEPAAGGLSEAEVLALAEAAAAAAITEHEEADPAHFADAIGFDGTESGLDAETVQDAIDEHIADHPSGGGGGWSSGTSFPGSPSSGDLFYRTDVRGGMLFRYDGTRWLSDQLFQMTLYPFQGVSSDQFFFSYPLPDDYAVYIVAAQFSSFGGAGGGTWVHRLKSAEHTENYPDIATWTFTGYTAGRWYTERVPAGVVLDTTPGDTGSTPRGLAYNLDETAGSDTIYGGCVVEYRLIAT